MTEENTQTDVTTEDAAKAAELEREAKMSKYMSDISELATSKLRADRVRPGQVASYLGHWEALTEALPDDLSREEMLKVAKSEVKNKPAEEAMIAAWSALSPAPPKSHLWLKGLVATILAVDELPDPFEETATEEAQDIVENTETAISDNPPSGETPEEGQEQE